MRLPPGRLSAKEADEAELQAMPPEPEGPHMRHRGQDHAGAEEAALAKDLDELVERLHRDQYHAGAEDAALAKDLGELVERRDQYHAGDAALAKNPDELEERRDQYHAGAEDAALAKDQEGASEP